ncbi:hypothetical protein BU26DRAFT_151093 [Trematosphaeria pertusa]|uniref:Histone chaperone domain-containing protein n=1 Tax=Trematosphaeria pertusa TaxID=390896 RepID=A0A6A6IXK4_9PLEO|nr:uncharacterized protein BU26DRAFT_151093 [Trematosphaeria pertusa]KAF2255124.1 hypothetical protein BU26DRAFT_151093 [Trematosphaeria pertusa]
MTSAITETTEQTATKSANTQKSRNTSRQPPKDTVNASKTTITTHANDPEEVVEPKKKKKPAGLRRRPQLGDPGVARPVVRKKSESESESDNDKENKALHKSITNDGTANESEDGSEKETWKGNERGSDKARTSKKLEKKPAHKSQELLTDSNEEEDHKTTPAVITKETAKTPSMTQATRPSKKKDDDEGIDPKNIIDGPRRRRGQGGGSSTNNARGRAALRSMSGKRRRDGSDDEDADAVEPAKKKPAIGGRNMARPRVSIDSRDPKSPILTRRQARLTAAPPTDIEMTDARPVEVAAVAPVTPPLVGNVFARSRLSFSDWTSNGDGEEL